MTEQIVSGRAIYKQINEKIAQYEQYKSALKSLEHLGRQSSPYQTMENVTQKVKLELDKMYRREWK